MNKDIECLIEQLKRYIRKEEEKLSDEKYRWFFKETKENR